MGGGPSGSSTSKATIPKELRPLYEQTGTGIQELQNQIPVSGFTGENPLQIAPLARTQNLALGNIGASLESARSPLESSEQAQVARRLFDMNRPTGGLETGPTIEAGRRYYQSSIAPGVENRAALSGLGRSTALTNALATTEAQTMLPLLQEEQARRDRLQALEAGTYLPLLSNEQARRDALVGQGLQAGQVERGAEQDVYTAAYQDFLRRQGLGEQALFGPMNQLPSTFGQRTSTSQSGGGLFK